MTSDIMYIWLARYYGKCLSLLIGLVPAVQNTRTAKHPDAVDIDLPALVSVRDLVVNGHVRRFVCPNHTTKYFYFY